MFTVLLGYSPRNAEGFNAVVNFFRPSTRETDPVRVQTAGSRGNPGTGKRLEYFYVDLEFLVV